MTGARPRERVLRALDALLPFLHGFVNQALEESAYRGKRVAADIGPLAHAIREEWRGVFAPRLERPVRNYVHELLDIRNRLAHSQPFDDAEARRACDTIRLVAKAVGAPLTEYDRRAGVVDAPARSIAPATSAPEMPRPRTATIRRRPTQRNVMRDIWARCAHDEERAVRESAAAERRGDAPRKGNKSGHTAEQYARALLADGVTKGWLKESK